MITNNLLIIYDAMAHQYTHYYTHIRGANNSKKYLSQFSRRKGLKNIQKKNPKNLEKNLEKSPKIP